MQVFNIARLHLRGPPALARGQPDIAEMAFQRQVEFGDHAQFGINADLMAGYDGDIGPLGQDAAQHDQRGRDQPHRGLVSFMDAQRVEQVTTCRCFAWRRHPGIGKRVFDRQAAPSGKRVAGMGDDGQCVAKQKFLRDVVGGGG